MSAAVRINTDPLVFPCPIVVDTREQQRFDLSTLAETEWDYYASPGDHPFDFASLVADAADGRRPIAVQIVTKKLNSGDYSLVGHERSVAVERKSVPDLVNSIGQERARFGRELERLSHFPSAWVVCEGDWEEIATYHDSRPSVGCGACGAQMALDKSRWVYVCENHSPFKTKRTLSPKMIFRSVLAWQFQYPTTHWWFCSGRPMAERVTFRILQRFYRTASERSGGE